MTTDALLPSCELGDLLRRSRDWLDAPTLDTARRIIDRVRTERRRAVEELSIAFGERAPEHPLVLGRAALQGSLAAVDAECVERLRRVARRIETFAQAQRDALREVTMEVPGGRIGHTVRPVAVAGCYAPGGRYPLPSSVLMTAVTARAAGVRTVVVASPRPSPMVLAAAAVADADALLVAGGAQAIAALALGIEGVPRSDVVVGPGNRYVSAAKQLLSGEVGIDMLAGPTELVIIADDTASPRLVAADLLAQAEHDPDALPVLITTSPALARAVETELRRQIRTLPTAAVARASLARGGVLHVPTLDEGVTCCNALAPEHVAIVVRDPGAVHSRLTNAGAVFVGEMSAEVLGDYGVGPNHVLPTAGTARYAAGLSVFTFLRVQTWLEFTRELPQDLVDDVTWLARVEGLEGHARAVEARFHGGGGASPT